jgi:transposase
LLYDLTNSYFEGQAEANSLAARSMNSKENRTDCPLVALGMVLDADGFPLCHKVFPGNIHDCKTIGDIVIELRKLSGMDKTPTVILDGGIATEETWPSCWRRATIISSVANDNHAVTSMTSSLPR